MRKIGLCVILVFFLESCTPLKPVSKVYDVTCVDTCIVEENGFFVKRYIIGDRPFSIRIDELTRNGEKFRIKMTVIDNVCNENVPYPCLYLVSVEGSQYRIDKEICTGDISGNIDCIFKPKSVIRPTIRQNVLFIGLFMPYQHFFWHLVYIPVST